jgi:hypothetical protein
VPIGFASLALVNWLVVEPEVLERETRSTTGFRHP